MKLRKEFITYAMDDRQIMVSSDTKRFSGMVRSNETAAFIIDCLKEETDKDGIISKMMQKYDAPKETIAADVDKVIDTLRSINAIEE